MMLIPMRIGDRAKKVNKINAGRSFIGFKKLGKRGEGIKIQSRGIESIIIYIKSQNCNENENEDSPPHQSTEHAECTDYRGSSFLTFAISGIVY